MKKRFVVAAIALASGCAFIFAGCAGCGNNGKANEAALSSNWYADTNYKYIQPTFVGESNAEVIEYNVELDKSTATNKSYSVDYEGGKYVTTFYATKFNKGLIAEDYREAYPDDVTVYCYQTELTVKKITFTFGTDTKEFTDKYVRTTCYFMDVNHHLQPLYSNQQVNMASPAEYQVSSIKQAYIEVNQTVVTSYNYNGTAAKTEISVMGYDGMQPPTTSVTNGLDKTDNSLIDVNGLNIAVRAMQLSESLNQVISMYSPSGKMQNFTFTGSSTSLSDAEKTASETVLKGKKLLGEDKSLKTVCVTCTLNSDKDMSGVSQKYWFTAIENVRNNTGRATLVKMSYPLTFNLGTVNYSLKEVTSTLY